MDLLCTGKDRCCRLYSLLLCFAAALRLKTSAMVSGVKGSLPVLENIHYSDNRLKLNDERPQLFWQQAYIGVIMR